MKTIEEFESYFNTTLSQQLIPLEKIRKKGQVYIKIIGFSVLGIILIALLTGFILHRNNQEFTWVIITGFTAIVLVMIVFGIRIALLNYKKKFKKEVIEPIIHFISPDLNYNPKKFIKQNDFKKSNLFLEKFNRYKGDDFVEGVIDKTKIRFSELNVENVTKSDKSENTSRVFKGLFFIADFNKTFVGSTVLIPNRLGMGKTFLKKMAGLVRKEKLVQLEDPDFAKNFNCYSTDDIKARYILSPALMSRINEFKKNFPSNQIHLSFVDDHIYVAISHTKDLFEPSFHHSVLDFNNMKAYFEDVYFVVSIVDILNLNTRIWSKE